MLNQLHSHSTLQAIFKNHINEKIMIIFKVQIYVKVVTLRKINLRIITEFLWGESTS